MVLEHYYDVTCPGCHVGHMVHKTGKFGDFYGCSTWPDCTTTMSHYEMNMTMDPDWDDDLGIPYEDTF